MTDYFNWFLNQEYPNGATADERREVSNLVDELEDKLFADLPWLIHSEDMAWLHGKTHHVEMTEGRVNDVVKTVYKIMRGNNGKPRG